MKKPRYRITIIPDCEQLPYNDMVLWTRINWGIDLYSMRMQYNTNIGTKATDPYCFGYEWSNYERMKSYFR